MYIDSNYNNSISFNARIGANLRLKLLNDEFGGSAKRLEKFERLFHDTFEKHLDENTIIDITDAGRFRLSNLIDPKITYTMRALYKEKPLAQRVLTMCHKIYANEENILFIKIISKKVKSGKSLEEIGKMAEKLDKYKRPYLNDLIETASRILEENPYSKLTEFDFLEMLNIQLQEIINTPEFQKAIANGNFAKAVKILK